MKRPLVPGGWVAALLRDPRALSSRFQLVSIVVIGYGQDYKDGWPFAKWATELNFRIGLCTHPAWFSGTWHSPLLTATTNILIKLEDLQTHRLPPRALSVSNYTVTLSPVVLESCSQSIHIHHSTSHLFSFNSLLRHCFIFPRRAHLYILVLSTFHDGILASL